MPRKKPTVWVVMHYEFVGVEPCVHIDSVQFHVSSSLRKAEKYIREYWDYPFSWWQVHPHVLDAEEGELEGEEVHYYSHKGAPVPRPPYKRAQKAFERDKMKNPHLH